MKQTDLFAQFDQQQITRKSGAELRELGMSRAVEHADSVSPDWSKSALDFINRFPSSEFMAEQLREFAYANGLAKPPHERAWGAVITAAKKLGLIVHDRYASVENPKAHATPASVWRKVK